MFGTSRYKVIKRHKTRIFKSSKQCQTTLKISRGNKNISN